MALFNTTCKHATYLLSKKEEDLLSWKEKLQLRTHLAICLACRLFDIQTRHICNETKNVHVQEHLTAQAKQRMQEELTSKMY